MTTATLTHLLTGTCVQCGFGFEFRRRPGPHPKYCDECRLFVRQHPEQRQHRVHGNNRIDMRDPNILLAQQVVHYRLAFEMISFLAWRGMKADMEEIREIIRSVEAPTRSA